MPRVRAAVGSGLAALTLVSCAGTTPAASPDGVPRGTRSDALPRSASSGDVQPGAAPRTDSVLGGFDRATRGSTRSPGPPAADLRGAPLAQTPSEPATAPPAARDPLWARVHAMTLRDKVRQLMVPSFSGTDVPTGLIDGLHPGGLIYFDGNLTSQPQVATLSTRIQRAARGTTAPLLVMTDQEGGPVTRIPGTAATPAGAQIGGDAALARSTALGTGRLLSRLGVNTDLAPDGDVNTAGSGGVIGTRSFGSRPGLVSRLVAAQVCGYHAAGVAATVKHFPGHGSTSTDSHLRTAVIRESVAQWTATDLPPFVSAVRHHVDMVMVGHLAFPALDPTGRPATISPVLNRGLLRDKLGYRGVVISDALNMGGITSWGPPGQIAVQAVRAGTDMLLMPPQPSVAVQAVVAAVQDGRIRRAALDLHVFRILTLKRSLGLLGEPASLARCGS